MLSSLHRLSTEDLGQLAGALRAGWVAPPFSSLMLRNSVPDALADSVAIDLQTATEAGLSPSHVAEVVQLLVSDREQRASAEGLTDLVWTGPDMPGIVNRDTRVVVREMFRSARQSVLLAGYAVYQGQVIFKALAERMDQNSDSGFRCSWMSSGPRTMHPVQPSYYAGSQSVSSARNGPVYDCLSCSTIPGRSRRIRPSTPAFTPSAF